MKPKCSICDKRRKTIAYKTRILDTITVVNLCKECDFKKKEFQRAHSK